MIDPGVDFLRSEWRSLMEQDQASSTQIETSWDELARHYNEPKRAYHNFTHITELLQLANQLAEEILQLRLLKYAIFYHDIIYQVFRKDNEQKSAALAVERLQSIGMKPSELTIVDQQIRSTATHDPINPKDPDMHWLLDFDLEILSRPWVDYHTYTVKIRKEYQAVPEFLYRRGRKKVLRHFLDKPALYHTSFFQTQKEAQARQNLSKELEQL